MMTVIRIIAAVWLAVPFGQAFAQDRQGNDTPGDWRVEHYREFGIWKSICDEREEDGGLKQRCYLRYVDVFSPRPKFAAVFVFLFPRDGKSVFQFSFERRTRYADDGLVASDDGGNIIWRAPPECISGNGCMLEGEKREALLAAWQKASSVDQAFIDRHGVERNLSWSLDGFADAVKDYRDRAGERGLL